MYGKIVDTFAVAGDRSQTFPTFDVEYPYLFGSLTGDAEERFPRDGLFGPYKAVDGGIKVFLLEPSEQLERKIIIQSRTANENIFLSSYSKDLVVVGGWIGVELDVEEPLVYTAVSSSLRYRARRGITAYSWSV